MYLPDWVQQYKEPHTEIKCIKNGFYKYEVAYVYNKPGFPPKYLPYIYK